jgi:hypothetical protein
VFDVLIGSLTHPINPEAFIALILSLVLSCSVVLSLFHSTVILSIESAV